MRIKKIIRRIVLLLVLAGAGYAVYYGWVSFPIISGFGAKDLCSCMFVSGRPEADVVKEELGDFPLSLGSYKVNREDSSVTGTVWGMAKRKAIYRPGIGCTILNDLDEKTVRSQVVTIAPVPVLNTDTINWPMGDRVTDTFPAALDKTLLSNAVSKAFEEPFPDKKVRTRAVLVVYNGQLVAEQYGQGYNRNSKMLGWSMTKSVMSALTGILVQQGKLKVTDLAPIPAWNDANDPRHAITLQHLLRQESGLDFTEDYSGASDVTNMLYKRGDMAAFTASHSLKHAPGTVFNYSSGNSVLISYIIRQVTGANYTSFPATALFYKAGMYNTLLEPDASGTYVGSSYIFATARDFARFGLLYYNDGVCNNERLLPEGWVKETTTASATSIQKQYGYQFWLNGFTDGSATRHILPDAPADLYYADGYGFQDIYIIPSRKLVIVRLGLTLDKSFDENAFLKNILAAVKP